MQYRRYVKITIVSLALVAFPLTRCCASSVEARGQEKPAVAANSPEMLSPELRGDLLMVHRQYMEAVDAYRKAPRDSAVVCNKLGIAYHHLFALDQARMNYQRALQLNPRYGEALNNLGAVYYAEKDYKRAEKLYRKALKLAPRTATVYNNLGTAYFADNKLKQGAEAYRVAFAIDPQIFAGDALQTIPESASTLERARLYYCMAELYAQAGMKPAAIEYLRKAIDAGFNDSKRLMRDEEFRAIRQSAEFEQLMAALKTP